MTMPQQGNYTSINWFNNTFYCYLNNDDIYQYNGELIGVSLNKYKQVEEALAKCKNRLIELGEIKIPKTPEEIIKEQSGIIDKQSKAFNEMMGMLTELKEKELGLEIMKPIKELTKDPTEVNNNDKN